MGRDAVSVSSVALLCVAASLIGGRSGDILGRPGRVVSSDLVAEEAHRFRAALDQVEQNFADPIDGEDAIYQGAIGDPH